MKRLIYRFKTFVDPQKVEINVDDEFYSYRCWTPEDWPKLLSLARAAGKVLFKETTKQPLTKEEELAKTLFWGMQRPRLSVGENGKIEVSDGRHRMQALKETNTELEMEISADVCIERVKSIKDVVSIEKTEPYFSYLLFEKLDVLQFVRNLKELNIPEIYDMWDRKDYIVISKTALREENIKNLVDEMERKGVKAYKTEEKIGKDIFDDER